MAKRMVAYEIKTPFGSSSLGLAIPEGFTRIEKGAFENMDIDTVIFPKSLEVIEDNAFKKLQTERGAFS